MLICSNQKESNDKITLMTSLAIEFLIISDMKVMEEAAN